MAGRLCGGVARMALRPKMSRRSSKSCLRVGRVWRSDWKTGIVCPEESKS
jgi:hypothetical protein